MQQSCKAAAPSLGVAVVFAQDLIELRASSWVARREVEGPKKIDQVHEDARRDDANRARAAGVGPSRQGKPDRSWRTGGGSKSLYCRGGLPARYAHACLAQPAVPLSLT